MTSVYDERSELLQGFLSALPGELLGLGVEYYAKAISYFERMRQIEQKSEQVVAHFPPLSYLLTSDNYASHLKQTLMEAAQGRFPAAADGSGFAG